MRIQLRDGGRTADPTGYGQINRGLLKSLRELGHDVGTDLAPIDAEVEIFACPPYGFIDLKPNTFNVAITMTERETVAGYRDRFDWVGLCNQMDLIITPSQWNKGVFEREGIIKPMVVLPMGIDLDFWKPRPYRFLSVIDGLGARSSRWNWQELIDAYKTVFAEIKDVEWTIKSRDAKPGDWSNEQPKITIIDDVLTEEQMLRLFQEHDCYLSYSREGWGYPIWQALACGLDVIVPNYGVQKETLTGHMNVHSFDVGHLSQDNLKFEGGNPMALIDAISQRYVQSRRVKAVGESCSWDWIAGGLIREITKARVGQ